LDRLFAEKYQWERNGRKYIYSLYQQSVNNPREVQFMNERSNNLFIWAVGEKTSRRGQIFIRNAKEKSKEKFVWSLELEIIC
jgi:hypothetical protein